MSDADQRPPIEVPHGERSANPMLDAEFIIAEAMILDLERGMGRIKYRPAAEHAVRSLIAAGWTPPAATGANDEASRLRALIATLRAHLDEDNAHMHRMHEAEQAAVLAHQRISMAAMNQAFSLEKEAAAAVKLRNEPEPTMTYTQIAKGLMKLSDLGKNAAKRDQKRVAKPKSVETVAMTLPGMDDAAERADAEGGR